MSAFASGREFSAFLGLTPRQSSTGGKERLGRITRMGDRYLRKLLFVGACATLSHRKGHNDALRLWASGMLERKTVKYKFKLTAVALANKVVRIVFVLMTRGGQYDDRPVGGYSIGCFRRQGNQHRGRRRNDVNQRQRLGSPNSGQRQFERERMMRRRAMRTNHQGQRRDPRRTTGRRHDRARDVHNSFKATLDHGAPSRHDGYLRSPAVHHSVIDLAEISCGFPDCRRSVRGAGGTEPGGPGVRVNPRPRCRSSRICARDRWRTPRPTEEPAYGQVSQKPFRWVESV